MAEFVGATVTITLAERGEPKIRGLIVKVSEGRLILEQVRWLENGARQDSLVIDGENILDLDIEQEAPPAAPTSVPCNDRTIDPAILSYARPSSTAHVSAVNQSVLQPNNPQGASRHLVSPLHSPQKVFEKPHVGSSIPEIPTGVSATSAILTEPFNAPSINGHVDIIDQHDTTTSHGVDIARVEDRGSVQGKGNAIGPRTRPKRNRRRNTASKDNKHNEPQQATSILQDDPKIAPQLTPKLVMGSGWRQTPLTEVDKTPSINSPQPQKGLEARPSTRRLQVPGHTNGKAGRRTRKHRPSEHDDQSGWATGEATDIQDMGDFDFEENHRKFDKKKVFEQIRQDDTTADEARLVSLNRLPPRPGTHGGRNLHYTENVLDSPTRTVAEHSSDSDSGINKVRNGSGRATRRSSSKLSQKIVSSRKGSGYVDLKWQMAGSGAISDIRDDGFQRGSYEAPVSSNPSLRGHRSSRGKQPSLRTAASDHRCPYVTPLQMLELEQIAMTELSMTEDMITENAALGIARTARQMAIVTDEYQSGNKFGSNPPLIVVLAGNHKTGSRAIAAARQLLNHCAQVVLCVLGLEQHADLLDSVRRQLNIFRKRGGRVVQQGQLMDTLKVIHASDGQRQNRPITTNLIIDALLGMHLSFEDLSMEHQTAYSQLVHWANTCNVTTISIDVPSGVDSSTGATPDKSHIPRLKAEASRTGVMLQGDPALVVAAHHVISLGVPKIGLVLGKDNVAGFQNHYSWLVADIGLDDTVWKKSGLHGGHGVEFGSEWVTTLEFFPEPEN